MSLFSAGRDGPLYAGRDACRYKVKRHAPENLFDGYMILRNFAHVFQTEQQAAPMDAPLKSGLANLRPVAVPHEH